MVTSTALIASDSVAPIRLQAIQRSSDVIRKSFAIEVGWVLKRR